MAVARSVLPAVAFRAAAGGRRRIGTYVGVWAGAAILAVCVFLLLADRDVPAVETRPLAMLLFVAVTAAAEGVVLNLQRGESKEAITLVEAAAAANMLLFDPATALGVTLGGMALGNLVHRRPPIKVGFNLAQYAVALVSASSIFHAVAGDSDPLSTRAFAGLVLGMAAYGAVNAAAITGLVSILERKTFSSMFRDGPPLSNLAVFGNTAVGMLTAVVWHVRPELAGLMFVPAATLHLAYKGQVRSRELLERAIGERDRLSRIVDGASDGIVLVDAEGCVDVWSPAMTRMTGIPDSEARGRSLDQVLLGRTHAGDTVDPLAPLRNATAERRVSVVEFVLPHREGGERVVRSRHTSLFDQQGRCAGDAVLVHDVTLDREIEGMKDDFLARVSHELRTPLTPIKGYAQALLRKIEDTPRHLLKEGLTRIVERVDHMTLLVDDLLLVSRLVAGQGRVDDQIRPEEVDLEKLCIRTLAPFRMMEPQRHFSLEGGSNVLMITTDPTRLEQILANLLSNACKYSPPDKPVVVEIATEPGHVVVSVTDEGRGVPVDQLEKIFERFHRVESPLTMSTGGIGLGLHITRQFVDALGGDLSVTSKLGEGSRFSVKLPHDPPRT